MQYKNTIVIRLPESTVEIRCYKIFGFPETVTHDPSLLSIYDHKNYGKFRVICLEHSQKGLDLFAVGFGVGTKEIVDFTMCKDSFEARNKAMQYLESVGAFDEA